MPSVLALDDAAALRRLERAENFPVALRVLPRRYQRDLRAVYDVARLIDDVGDSLAAGPEQRVRLLDRIEVDLRVAFAGGQPELEAVRGLLPAVAAGRLAPAPFLALVEANRLDQTVSRYPTYDDLLHYCSLSADPVGRIVLAVFGVRDDVAQRLSDQVCSALQILEHCQDVGEDRRDRDRVYLPLEDLDRFGVTVADLDAPAADGRVRALVAFEVTRAAALLDQGARLVPRLQGAARVAVAGYVAGGRATVEAIRRSGHDVLSATPRPRRRDVLRHALRLWAGPR